MKITVDDKTYALPDDINRIASLPPGPYQLAIRVVKASAANRHWASLIQQQRERLSPNGGLGVDAPVRRNGAWASIKDIALPFGEAHGGNDSKQFGYWFNYFWTEAREAYDLNPAGQTQLCDAFFAALESNGQGAFRPNANLASLDDTHKQNILLKVMRVGFKRIQVGPAKAASRVPQALDARTMFALNISGQGQPARVLPLGFRGDNRSIEDLKKSGFFARARSRGAQVHAQYGMDQAWHPFNLSIYADSLLVRKGKSKDNCLHTVVSVASRLQDMLPYPLLSDGSLFKLAFKDPAEWTAEDVAYVRSHWMGLEIVREGGSPAGRIDRLTTIKYIYLLDLSKSQAFDTEAWQSSLSVSNPFPERAVDQVLPEQILGVLKTRKNYFYRASGSRESGGAMTLFDIELLSFDFMVDESVIKARFGDLAPTDIRETIERGVRIAKHNISGEKTAYERAKQVPNGQTGQQTQHKCPSCNSEFRSRILMQNHQRQAGH